MGKARGTKAIKDRVEAQDAFVLHSYPYSETSLIVEVFARDYGRVAMVARGARRPRSVMRGVLAAFQPLELGWFGRNEMKTLTKAEWQGGQPLLQRTAFMLAYYMNELLLKLLPREDAHPCLFDAYQQAVYAIAVGEPGEVVLRVFEKKLLKELGYALTLDHEIETGHAIDSESFYLYIPERGPVKASRIDMLTFSGSVLLAIAEDDYRDPQTLAHGKRLMRLLINHHLGGQSLSSRRVFAELQEL